MIKPTQQYICLRKSNLTKQKETLNFEIYIYIYMYWAKIIQIKKHSNASL